MICSCHPFYSNKSHLSDRNCGQNKDTNQRIKLINYFSSTNHCRTSLNKNDTIAADCSLYSLKEILIGKLFGNVRSYFATVANPRGLVLTYPQPKPGRLPRFCGSSGALIWMQKRDQFGYQPFVHAFGSS